MIAPIPNQPVNFLASSLFVACRDKRLPLIYKDDDEVRFQVSLRAPSGGYTYSDTSLIRDWDPGTDWGGPGSWVGLIDGGVCAIAPAAGGYIEPITSVLSPIVGAVYQVTIDVTSITSTATFSMGGQSVPISMPGLQTITITAATTDGPRITLDNPASRICVLRVRVYASIETSVDPEDAGCVVTVEVVDAATDEALASWTPVNRPEIFEISGNVMSIVVPMADVPDIGSGSCLFIRMTDSCDDGSGPLCSQPISIDNDCADTMLIRACLDHDAMGFAAPGIFQARLKASLVRPRWDVDASEERWSDGTINRYFVDRQRIMDLMVQPVDESLMPFITALCMFDHVYLDGAEYVLDTDSTSPAYGEQTGTAAIQIEVRPKREMLRRVACDVMGDGCAPSTDPQCPPPNVQISHYYDADSGGYFVELIVYSAIGFVPDRINVLLDGDPYASEIWAIPTSYQFGPFPIASLIEVEVTNATEPSCDWSTSIRLPTCEGPGFGRFRIFSEDAFDINVSNFVGEPEFFALRRVAGDVIEPPLILPTGVTQAIDGSPVAQEFCVHACDSDGNPMNTMTDLNIVNSGFSSNGLLELDISGLVELGSCLIGYNNVGSFDASNNPNLAVFGARDNDGLTSLAWPPGPTTIVLAEFVRCTVLTVLPQLDPSLIDDGTVLDFTGCALGTDAVNMLITSAYDSGKMFGVLYMALGTNAPLPVSGPVYDMLDELNSRGWDVNGN